MGRALFESSPGAARLFRQADELLGYPLSEICFSGPQEVLDATEHSQPALLVCSIAALAAMKEQSPDQAAEAEACAGLSLGEYTAMVFAQAISFEDGLHLVRQRGLAMQAAADARPSGMASILGLDEEKVAALCDAARQPGEVLKIANLLCPGNIAISGDARSCQAAVELAPGHGAMRAVPLAVAGAFHTEIMHSAEEKLARALADVPIRPPRCPVISNVDARPHSDPDEIRDLLVRQVCSPVRWSESMQWILDQGCNRFVEVGHGRVLRGLLKRISRQVECTGYPDAA
jgi:[acyl-carrier-protein] S-malonyltransferase